MSAQAVQIAAGIVVVSAYAGVQMRWLNPIAPLNLYMNFGGTGVLAGVAIWEGQVGFLLTNGFWALISLASLWRLRRSRHTAPAY